MKYDACNECSHRPDAIARTEDILFWGGLGLSRLTGLWSPAGTPPEGIVSELNEVGQAVIPYMEKLKNTPAKLLMFTRYLYLLGVQRGCELFRNETLGGGVEMKKPLRTSSFVITADIWKMKKWRRFPILSRIGLRNFSSRSALLSPRKGRSPVSDAAVRRLAAMLTEAQRAQIVQLAQVITAPATTAGVSQAQTPGT